jgi:hypothetical protein
MSSESESRFDAVANAFARDKPVTREAKKGFGSGALKVNGKIFAMLSSKEEFVVKLPKSRVEEMVRSRVGHPFQPGPGRVMKEWLAIPVSEKDADWTELAREACSFVGNFTPRRRRGA